MKRRRSKQQQCKYEQHRAAREAFREEFWLCMACGFGGSQLDIHEILCGKNRTKSFARRELWLLLCRKCHDEVQNWPLARQLALKLREDPWWFDLDVVREVKATGGVIVTMADLREAMK